MAAGAYIDLKNCQFFLEDGFEKIGAVNFMAGYAAGASTAVVDGFTGAVETGTSLRFAGHDTVYTITAHSETSMNTTSITFTPVLTDAITDGEVVTTGPHVLEVVMGDGNLTYDENKAREYKLNRGLLDQVRNGDEAPIDVSFSFAWTYLSCNTGGTVPTVEDFFKQRGPAEDYTTTGADCEPYAVNIVLINTPPTCGSTTDPIERITLPQFRFEKFAHDPKAGTVTCTGKCNVTEALVERLSA